MATEDPTFSSLERTIGRRDAAVQRVVRALSGDTKEEALRVITSWMPIENVEAVAEFLENR